MLIAWHGSPVLFDRFDAGKIGSQWKHGGAEGYGIYLTDRQEVAAGYAVPGWRGGAAVRAQNGFGYLYEVEAPTGEYIDNAELCADQPEPARSIFVNAMADLKGPMAGYWRFVLDSMDGAYSQVGRLLCYSRKCGNALEPILLAAGYVGCKNRVEAWGGASEFVVFDPRCLTILSVAPQVEKAAA